MKFVSFLVFITSAIAIYASLNYYYIKKHRGVLTGKYLSDLVLKLILLTLAIAPVATVVFSMNEIPFLAAITGFVGYSWLAFLFLFLVIHGFFDLLLYIVEKLKIFYHPMASRIIYFATVTTSVFILIFGSYEARNIQLEEVSIDANSWLLRDQSYKIALISDVHFSPLTGPEAARRLIKIMNDVRPDILVSTGDLLDRGVREADEVIELLRTIKPPLGKFAIMGNHEYYYGLKRSIDFAERAGFKVLRNEAITINDKLNLVGVDDRTAKRFNQEPPVSELEVLQSVDTSKYTILLKHQPRVLDGTTKHFDLQLSGHTHAGQIFPFSLLVRLVFKYICGLYEIDDGTKIYVNRGTGTWGPPFRFLAPPEVTIINIH